MDTGKSGSINAGLIRLLSTYDDLKYYLSHGKSIAIVTLLYRDMHIERTLNYLHSTRSISIHLILIFAQKS